MWSFHPASKFSDLGTTWNPRVVKLFSIHISMLGDFCKTYENTYYLIVEPGELHRQRITHISWWCAVDHGGSSRALEHLGFQHCTCFNRKQHFTLDNAWNIHSSLIGSAIEPLALLTFIHSLTNFKNKIWYRLGSKKHQCIFREFMDVQNHTKTHSLFYYTSRLRRSYPPWNLSCEHLPINGMKLPLTVCQFAVRTGTIAWYVLVCMTDFPVNSIVMQYDIHNQTAMCIRQ